MIERSDLSVRVTDQQAKRSQYELFLPPDDPVGSDRLSALHEDAEQEDRRDKHGAESGASVRRVDRLFDRPGLTLLVRDQLAL